MAHRGKSAAPNLEDLTARIAQLELENKELKKKVKSGSGATAPKGALGPPTGPPKEKPLTPAQKEAMAQSAIMKLSAIAAQKIEARVRSTVAKCTTKPEMEAAILDLKMRIDLSVTEVREGARRRALSRGRDKSRDRE